MALKRPVNFDDPACGIVLRIHDGDPPRAIVGYRTSDERIQVSAEIAIDPEHHAVLADLAAVVAQPETPEIQEQFLRFANLTSRAQSALPAVASAARAVVRWLLSSREDTNYTYDLTPQNRRHLAHVISVVTAHGVDEIKAYVAELENDADLCAHIAAAFDRQPPAARAIADRTARYGRRLGWYALVRALKPRLVVETGVDKGLGSVVLCAALVRNCADGTPGRYLGTDLRPDAGGLLTGQYAEVGRILYGDSIASLETIAEPIDLFINDSDHAPDYEAREYETIAARLGEKAVIAGDNAHDTDKLADFADATGRRFVFFREESQDHFYSGAGIGFAFR